MAVDVTKGKAGAVRGAACGGQVYKAFHGSQAVAIREFRYELTQEEAAQLHRLVAKLSRCNDRHIVKTLGIARIPGPRAGWLIASQVGAAAAVLHRYDTQLTTRCDAQ